MINIIAMVSMVAVAIPTAAMIILLAMFGGLSRTIETIYSAVDADIEIITNRGQTFSSNAVDIELIRATEGIVAAAPYLEQSVMVATSSRRCTVRLRGVDSTYMEVLPISDFVIRGSVDALSQGNILLGTAASGSLGIPNVNYPVELSALNRKQLSTLLPTGGISRHSCQLGGVVSANAEIDATFAMVDIDIAEKLLNYEDKLSGVAIKVEDREQIEGVKRVLQEIVGKELTVRTREEKSVEMNSLIRLEKFAIILIGTFIAIIAAFAIVGAVVMLITDKRRDISTLRSMGASRGLIHKIFVGEGALLTLVGAAIGTTIGVGFSLGQEHFRWIKIPGNMVFESYPIELTVADTLLVLGIVIVAGLSISHLTVRARLRNEDKI